jgi:predicted Fe-Mo cluster-binding NifX family protein
MDLTYAFALNHENQFAPRHFGDADKFAIYRREGEEIKFVKDIDNKFRDYDEEVKHGSKKKGKAIIDFLKSEGVNVLVSRQFGRNITMVNKHFIPVVITNENPEEVVEILRRHRHWIVEEWESSKSDFKLFKVKSSVLKLRIEE